MGCARSKLDDLPAVSLCRERCSGLDEAVIQRHALADAHLAYISSLRGIAHSLHDLFELTQFASGRFSPVLNLPPHGKGSDPAPAIIKGGGGGHRYSRSNSGSHLHLPSDSDEESGSGSVSLHHSDHSSPAHFQGGHVEYMKPSPEEDRMVSSFQGDFLHMSYMKNKATTSVVYEQRPPTSSQGTIRFGESSSSATYYPYPYQSNDPYPYYGDPNYRGGSAGGYAYSSLPPPSSGSYGYSSQSPVAEAEPSAVKPPPPPPSPPQTSTWDFLNPFETYDRYYTPYTRSRNSREVREEEGIPYLEDGGYQHEVIKEVQVHGNQKFMDAGYYLKSVAEEEHQDIKVEREAHVHQAGPGPAAESSRMEDGVHVVDKKVVDDEGELKRSQEHRGSAGRWKGFQGVSDVVEEIKIQFERASELGNKIARMIDAGKLPYRRRHQVTSKMVNSSVMSSKASTSSSADPSSSEVSGPAYGEEEVGMRSRNLSSTLHKLYLLEKKLYSEVKSEEKMRVIHERKSQKLKRLDQWGAEATKVDATRKLVRSLSTKIRIAIQVVDKISVTINKIRDEELWPQLSELIQGLSEMWKSMLECHHSQCQAIGEAGGLGPIGLVKKHSHAHLEATLQFERELINWTLRFSSWITAQKDFVKALDKWLLKCLLYEPEETPDGIAPFSPSRIGAPPIFVICRQWAQALDRIPEKEVLSAMRIFLMGLLHLWKQDKCEMKQRMEMNKDLEKVKNLDREDQRIDKQVQAMDKKIVLFASDEDDLSVSGPAIDPSGMSIDLQASLRHIFEAMESFMDSLTRVYEDLIQRCKEEQKLAQERESGS